MPKGQVFISYAREDEVVAEQIYEFILTTDYKPWRDKEDIFGGEYWNNAIERAINGADLFVVVLSSNSVNKRGYYQKEIKLSLEKWKEKHPDDIYIIPIVTTVRLLAE